MPLFGKKKLPTEREVRVAELTKYYKLVLRPAAVVEIVDNLMTGEEIRIVIKGLWDSAIVATQYRVFVSKRGMMGGVTGGSKLISWDMDAIHGVQMEFGRQTGFVALQTPNATVADMSYWASDATSPQKAPNAIAINKELKERAQVHVVELRTLLFERKHSIEMPGQPPVS